MHVSSIYLVPIASFPGFCECESLGYSLPDLVLHKFVHCAASPVDLSKLLMRTCIISAATPHELNFLTSSLWMSTLQQQEYGDSVYIVQYLQVTTKLMARDGRIVVYKIYSNSDMNFTQYWVPQSNDMDGRLSVIACLAGMTSCLVGLCN